MNIGIVGSGIAGLHLALLLQQRGVATTLYSELSAAAQRAGRLPNNVCRFWSTRERERELGVDHWAFPDCGVFGVDMHVAGDPPIAFRGDLAHMASFVDFRLYLPRLLDDYEARGGRVVVKTCGGAEVVEASRDHDLMVVASGRGAMAELFPRDSQRSPFALPQRHLLAGLFHGVAMPDPLGFSFHLIPGVGEILQSPMYSFAGPIAAVSIEATPAGPWEKRVRTPYDGDLGRCAAVVLDLLREYAPTVYERVDPAAFRLAGSRDVLQGSVTPTVRRPWASLGNGKFAIALGDASVLNDPVTGQGANLASLSAWTLGEAILEEFVFDERFCRWWDDRSWEISRDVTEWTNAFLGAPPPHLLNLLCAAMQEKAVADAFVNNFNTPRRMWRSMATPERTAAFLREIRAQPPAARPLHDSAPAIL